MRAIGPASGWVAVSLLMLLGCEVGSTPSAQRLHYVLPVGFRGEFRVYSHAADGVDLPIEDGRCVITIPLGGTLRVRGEGPFSAWHSRSLAYADGTAIPEATGGTPLPDDVVALRYGGADSEGFHFWVVGTASDYKRWAESPLRP